MRRQGVHESHVGETSPRAAKAGSGLPGSGGTREGMAGNAGAAI